MGSGKLPEITVCEQFAVPSSNPWLKLYDAQKKPHI